MSKKNMLKTLTIATIAMTTFTMAGSTLVDIIAVKAQESTEQTATNEVKIYGKVTAVDGTKVTLTLGDMKELDLANLPTPSGNAQGTSSDVPAVTQAGETTDGNQANRQQSNQSSQSPQNGQSPMNGQLNGQKPTGMPPANNGNREMTPPTEFTEGEETVTIDLSNVQIVMESMEGEQEATIDDIQVDTILEVTQDDAGNATKVVIKPMMGGPNRMMPQGGMMPGSQQSNLPHVSEQEETTGDDAS